MTINGDDKSVQGAMVEIEREGKLENLNTRIR